jgi:F0F1-type ATP synthase epsilon subunit
VPKTLKVTFATPSTVIAKDALAHQVDLCTAGEGDVGVLAGHVPAVLQLRPGVVRVRDADGGDVVPPHFASGGFAEVQGEEGGASVLSISAYAAAPVEHFDADAVARGVASEGEGDAAQNEIHREVYTAIADALRGVKSKSRA